MGRGFLTSGFAAATMTLALLGATVPARAEQATGASPPSSPSQPAAQTPAAKDEKKDDKTVIVKISDKEAARQAKLEREFTIAKILMTESDNPVDRQTGAYMMNSIIPSLGEASRKTAEMLVNDNVKLSCTVLSTENGKPKLLCKGPEATP